MHLWVYRQACTAMHFKGSIGDMQAFITLAKCDVAAAGDSTAAVHLLRRARLPALACILHASGILKARWCTLVSSRAAAVGCSFFVTACDDLLWRACRMRPSQSRVPDTFAKFLLPRPAALGGWPIAPLAGQWVRAFCFHLWRACWVLAGRPAMLPPMRS